MATQILQPRVQAPVRRTTAPILIWAVIGAFMVALFTYVYFRWMFTEEFVQNTFARDTVPTWNKIAVRSSEVLFTSAFLLCNYWFIWRPWRKNRKLSKEAILIFACGTMWWQDLLFNYTSYYAQLNTYFVNFGNPSASTPGWIAPNQGRAPEAIFAWGVAYASWFMVVPVLIGCFVFRRVEARNARIGRVGTIAIVYLFFLIFDLLLENAMVRLQLYTLGGAVRELSLFPGTVHQFPIYHSMTVAGLWCALSTLWYYRDDKGNTFVERGVDNLVIRGRAVGEKMKTFLRFLALAGIVNIAMVVIIEIPVNTIQLNADPLVEDLPPYLNAGLCGPKQTIACPSHDLPIATKRAPTNRTISKEELRRFQRGTLP